MPWTVYVHTCPNGKHYVGITSQEPKDRWNKGSGYYGQLFYNAIKKYKWKNIIHEILDVVDTVEEAVKLEEFYIKKYNSLSTANGYNISPSAVANHGLPRSRLSESTRLKISKALKGKTKVVSQAMLDHLKKCRSRVDRSKPKNYDKNKVLSGRRKKSVVVIQYDLQNNPIAIWESVNQAKREVPIRSHENMYRNNLSGYHWVKGSDVTPNEFIRLMNLNTPVHLMTGEIINLNIKEVQNV